MVNTCDTVTEKKFFFYIKHFYTNAQSIASTPITAFLHFVNFIYFT